MARAKKKKKIVEEVQLTEVQSKTLDLFEARVTTQGVVLENLRLKQEAITAEYRRQMASMKAQSKSTQDSMIKIKRDHNEFIKALEGELGIVMRDYSLEPDGLLIYNPLPDEESSG